jgi:hypothetical protein
MICIERRGKRATRLEPLAAPRAEYLPQHQQTHEHGQEHDQGGRPGTDTIPQQPVLPELVQVRHWVRSFAWNGR